MHKALTPITLNLLINSKRKQCDHNSLHLTGEKTETHKEKKWLAQGHSITDKAAASLGLLDLQPGQTPDPPPHHSSRRRVMNLPKDMHLLPPPFQEQSV